MKLLAAVSRRKDRCGVFAGNSVWSTFER